MGKKYVLISCESNRACNLETEVFDSLEEASKAMMDNLPYDINSEDFRDEIEDEDYEPISEDGMEAFFPEEYGFEDEYYKIIVVDY